MKTLLITNILVFLFIQNAKAERFYGINDSTVYAITPNLNYIASRHKFYLQIDNSSPQLLKDFTSSCPDPSIWYIADVDFWNEFHGYVLIKPKYITGVAYVYETEDGGITWVLRDDWAPNLHVGYLDTVQYPFNLTNYLNGITSDYCNINQLQILDSVLYLFLDYYQSGVYTTTNNGNNWDKWFEIAPSFFFQIKKCNSPNSDYYLIGWAGDGFGCRINVIPNDHFNNSYPTTTPADTFLYPCYPLNAAHCISGFSQFDSLAVFHPLEEVIENLGLIDSLCLNAPLNTNENFNSHESFQVYPNPTSGTVKVILGEHYPSTSIHLFNALGQVILDKDYTSTDEITFEIEGAPGVYFLEIESAEQVLGRIRVVKN